MSSCCRRFGAGFWARANLPLGRWKEGHRDDGSGRVGGDPFCDQRRERFFRLPGVPPGRYRWKATAFGFQSVIGTLRVCPGAEVVKTWEIGPCKRVGPHGRPWFERRPKPGVPFYFEAVSHRISQGWLGSAAGRNVTGTAWGRARSTIRRPKRQASEVADPRSKTESFALDGLSPGAGFRNVGRREKGTLSFYLSFYLPSFYFGCSSTVLKRET